MRVIVIAIVIRKLDSSFERSFVSLISRFRDRDNLILDRYLRIPVVVVGRQRQEDRGLGSSLEAQLHYMRVCPNEADTSVAQTCNPSYLGDQSRKVESSRFVWLTEQVQS